MKFFQNWRLPLAVLLIAIFANLQVISAYTDPEESKYAKYDNISDAVVAYNVNVNEIFNDKMELLVAGKGNTEPTEDCSEDNVTTYCVAKAVVTEYMEFESGLDKYTSEISIVDIETLSEATDVYVESFALIRDELDAARSAMDLALAIYNEFQIMSPLHDQYEVIIESLESYNKELSKWRDALQFWPGDFIDVSTNKCS